MLTIDRSIGHTGALWRSLLLAKILCKDITEVWMPSVWDPSQVGNVYQLHSMTATIVRRDAICTASSERSLNWYAPVGLSSLHKSFLSTQLVDIDEMGLDPGYNWSHLLETWSVCRRYFRHTREAVASLQFRPIGTSIEDSQEPILRRVSYMLGGSPLR